MYCISRDTGVSLGWKWKGNINSMIQRFLIFFFNCIILVQILTILKMLFIYDTLKSNFYPKLDTRACCNLSIPRNFCFLFLLLSHRCIFFVLDETLVNDHRGHWLQLKYSFFYSVLITGQPFDDFDIIKSNS